MPYKKLNTCSALPFITGVKVSATVGSEAEKFTDESKGSD